MNKTQSIRDVRRIYSIRNILGMQNKRKIVCPLPMHSHHHNTPSFSVFVGGDGVERFICFGNCGLAGDVIDLIGYMNIPGYQPMNGTHVLEARDLLEGEFEICIPDPPKKKLPPRPNAWMDYYPPKQDAIDFAIKRGLTQREIEKFKFGQKDNYLAMPTFEYNTLKGIKFRIISGNGLRFFSMKGSIHGLFNHDAVAYAPEPIAIVKGEIPVAVLDRFGILACAPDSGEMSPIDPWKHVFTLATKIVVIGDLDPDPRTRERIVAKTKERAEAVGGEVYFPPEGFDIDDWILSDPENVIPMIKGWMES